MDALQWLIVLGLASLAVCDKKNSAGSSAVIGNTSTQTGAAIYVSDFAVDCGKQNIAYIATTGTADCAEKCRKSKDCRYAAYVADRAAEDSKCNVNGPSVELFPGFSQESLKAVHYNVTEEVCYQQLKGKDYYEALEARAAKCGLVSSNYDCKFTYLSRHGNDAIVGFVYKSFTARTNVEVTGEMLKTVSGEPVLKTGVSLDLCWTLCNLHPSCTVAEYFRGYTEYHLSHSWRDSCNLYAKAAPAKALNQTAHSVQNQPANSVVFFAV
ncbi:uncharacterized protein LOC129592551 isoform X2 [Paramacrobiotus metropolitanus]|uniref:uncharacterized protein LOC129592551 isoform X2 n=1 Tax=Paramacrobiotus metropolitanus TaxID=2943436 RepID=UPI0024456C78|nr:uncharacterized protein LOC129592551 isoform X2 [Paramacrobiotus metropolitanus]